MEGNMIMINQQVKETYYYQFVYDKIIANHVIKETYIVNLYMIKS